ncbi:MAG: hypothetical protein U0821_21585 [Chloroflexota bacterium]
MAARPNTHPGYTWQRAETRAGRRRPRRHRAVARTMTGIVGGALVFALMIPLYLAVAYAVTASTTAELIGQLALVLLFGCPFLLGLWMLWSSLPGVYRRSAGARREHERRALEYGWTVAGRVTLAEVAAHCGLSLDEAQQTLDALAARHVATIAVAENGVLVYEFSGFLTEAQKAQARVV